MGIIHLCSLSLSKWNVQFWYLPLEGSIYSSFFFLHHSCCGYRGVLGKSNWLDEVELTSSVGPLSGLWPTAPPEPVCSSSAHVCQCPSAKQSPFDKQHCRSVLAARSLGLQFVVHSCGQHTQQSLENISQFFLLWPTGWASTGPLIRTSPGLHEPARYHYLECPLCLSCKFLLPEMSSGLYGHGLSVGPPAAQLSLASPLCEKMRQDYY